MWATVQPLLLEIWGKTLQFTEGYSGISIRRVRHGIIPVVLTGKGRFLPHIILMVKEIDSAVFNIEKIDLGAGVSVIVQGTNALVLKDANGTGITIKSNMSHNVADSGISIESNGNVNIGRSDGTFNTVASNGNGGTLQIRGQAIVNTGKLHANGLNGRLILAYESDYFEMGGGSKDYTQLIEMTRPQITGTLDLNMSYSITPTAVNEDYMTAWFRFEEGSGDKTYSDYGGYTGTFGGNGGNKPVLPPVNSEERLNFHRMNGFLPMLLPIPWKSGNQSQELSPFGLSLISSHIGDPAQSPQLGPWFVLDGYNGCSLWFCP